ncbi:Chorismate pyruvate-lyase [bioreactor metagenome]|uniref:Chorismate pyruvate-lyase n=1 Tax=bioreactor metagenome TaxID=1076179 RepID=A0A644TYS2_9ZZZZ|nr:chorismate lyase [Methanobrevibacter sp.]MEA4956407.1 chorismate lyase [Methanobrevibacter sp.]
MNNKELRIIDKIGKLEKKGFKLSNTQKILLATDGSVTTILDVLVGEIKIKTLKQEFQDADENIAKLLNIKKGEKVNYRVVVMFNESKPLIYATSYIPIKRLTSEFKKDLISADIPIGRILRKYNIESRREIQSVQIEDNPNEELKNIFKTNVNFLSRDYNIIHNDEILIWIEEKFPIDSFLKNYKD